MCSEETEYKYRSMEGGISVLQVNHVSKKIGTFQLQDINFELPVGYIVGLIGPNGSGKTTLLHLLLGLYKPNEGEISFEGMQYETKEHEIHEEIGTVLQERLFEENRNLIENANYYGKYYKQYDSKQMLRYLEKFALDPKCKYKRLSKGEELKFQFAFALAHQPKWLILDEPTGNFDPEFREVFVKELMNFIADGAHGVLMATHLTEDLDRIADYIIYLEKGKQLLAMDIERLHDCFRIVTGEAYKVKLLPKENIIHYEEGNYGVKALVAHKRRYRYDGLFVSEPTIEELMYFITKRQGEFEVR